MFNCNNCCQNVEIFGRGVQEYIRKDITLKMKSNDFTFDLKIYSHNALREILLKLDNYIKK